MNPNSQERHFLFSPSRAGALQDAQGSLREHRPQEVVVVKVLLDVAELGCRLGTPCSRSRMNIIEMSLLEGIVQVLGHQVARVP